MNEGIFDIDEFREITGLELDSEEEQSMFERANSRVTKKLESILGWNFKYRQSYEEIAVSNNPNTCPTEEQLAQWQEDPEAYPFFKESEGQIGDVKLFPYYPEDANYFIDPAQSINKVMLVKPISGDGYKFITVRELAPDDWLTKSNISFSTDKTPLINWIEICNNPTNLPCTCANPKSCYLLAVDGTWISKVPEDMKYFFADMIINAMRSQPTLEQFTTFPVASESVDGHSVSYNFSHKNPTLDDIVEANKAILSKYIGPYSPLYINKTRIS